MDIGRLERLLNPDGHKFDNPDRQGFGGDGDLHNGWMMIRTAIDEIIVAMNLQPLCEGKAVIWTNGKGKFPNFQGIVATKLPALPKKIPDRWKELLVAGVSIIKRRIAQEAKLTEPPPIEAVTAGQLGAVLNVTAKAIQNKVNAKALQEQGGLIARGKYRYSVVRAMLAKRSATYDSLLPQTYAEFLACPRLR